MKRRNFNKVFTTSLTGLSVSPSIISPFKPFRKLGVALVGLGSYSTKALGPALLKTKYCDLKAIVTGTPSKEKVWQKEYNLDENNVYNYQNFESISNNDEIDIVYIVLPNSMHKEYTIKALEAGKHVICEKPLALNANEARDMIKVSKKVEKELFVGYRLHYEPHHLQLIKMCKNEEFGKLKIINAAFGFNMRSTGHWKLKKSYGGGALMDVGVYAIQAARYTSNEEPISVSAKEYKTDLKRFNEVDETIVWEMVFPSGKVANCTTSFSSNLNYLHLAFERGFAKLNPAYGWGRVSGKMSAGELIFPQINQQAAQMDGICNYLNNQIPHNNVGGDEGLKDMIIIDKIMESVQKNGERIFI